MNKALSHLLSISYTPTLFLCHDILEELWKSNLIFLRKML